MRDIQRVYVLPQKDWKRHENSMVLWIMTEHFACVFLARRNQYTNVGKLFWFLSYPRIHIPTIVVTNWHSIVLAAEPCEVTLVVNISTSSYNWKGLNESFPAH